MTERLPEMPDAVLDRMEREGWVPSDVHQLIASYRALQQKVVIQKDLYKGALRMHAECLSRLNRVLSEMRGDPGLEPWIKKLVAAMTGEQSEEAQDDD